MTKPSAVLVTKLSGLCWNQYTFFKFRGWSVVKIELEYFIFSQQKQSFAVHGIITSYALPRLRPVCVTSAKNKGHARGL